MKLFDSNGNEIENSANVIAPPNATAPTTPATPADFAPTPAQQPAASEPDDFADTPTTPAAPAHPQRRATYRSGIDWIDAAIADGSITALDMAAAKEVYGIDVAKGLAETERNAIANAKDIAEREKAKSETRTAKAAFAKPLTDAFILAERILDMGDHAEQGGVLNALSRWVTKKSNSLIEGSDANDIFSNAEEKYIQAVMQLQKVKADRAPGQKELEYNEDRLRFGLSSPERIRNRVAHWAQDARRLLQYQIDQINEQGVELSAAKKSRLQEIDKRLAALTGSLQ